MKTVLNPQIAPQIVAWVDEFLTKQEPMTTEVTEAFLLVCQSEKTLDEKEQEIRAGEELSFLTQVLEARAKSLGLNLAFSTLLFLSELVQNPAESTMFLTVIKSKHIGEEKFTMTSLAYLMPTGYPSRKSLRELWNNQKDDEGHNMLDYAFVNSQ